MRECEQQASNACAMAMVDVGGMASEVRRALDCADLCDATERVLVQRPAADPALEAALVRACIVACEASAAACGRHADHHEHCRLHCMPAARCADELRSVAGSLSK